MQPLEEIYQSHARTVYHYLLSLTRDADLSEELTQEVFYQAVKNISRFDGSCKVSTWLCAIADTRGGLTRLIDKLGLATETDRPLIVR